MDQWGSEKERVSNTPLDIDLEVSRPPWNIDIMKVTKESREYIRIVS